MADESGGEVPWYIAEQPKPKLDPYGARTAETKPPATLKAQAKEQPAAIYSDPEMAATQRAAAQKPMLERERRFSQTPSHLQEKQVPRSRTRPLRPTTPSSEQPIPDWRKEEASDLQSKIRKAKEAVAMGLGTSRSEQKSPQETQEKRPRVSVSLFTPQDQPFPMSAAA